MHKISIFCNFLVALCLLLLLDKIGLISANDDVFRKINVFIDRSFDQRGWNCTPNALEEVKSCIAREDLGNKCSALKQMWRCYKNGLHMCEKGPEVITLTSSALEKIASSEKCGENFLNSQGTALTIKVFLKMSLAFFVFFSTLIIR